MVIIIIHFLSGSSGLCPMTLTSPCIQQGNRALPYETKPSRSDVGIIIDVGSII